MFNEEIKFSLLLVILLTAGPCFSASEKQSLKLDTIQTTVRPMDLIEAPSHEDLVAAGQLGGHLYPTVEVSEFDRQSETPIISSVQRNLGQEPLNKKGKRHLKMRSDFGEAIQAWNKHEYKSAYQKFQKYKTQYPESPWSGEAELHMACEARYNGRYTEAEQKFNSIISNYQQSDYIGAKMLVEKAKSRLAVLKVLQNNHADATAHFSDIKENAEDWRLRTYAANWIQRISRDKSTGTALLDCGTQALAHLLKKDRRHRAAKKVLAIKPTNKKGQSLSELKSIAEKYGYTVGALHINTSQLSLIKLPAIVQINAKKDGDIGHYWILEKLEGNRLTIRDPQIPRRFKQSISEFSQEWSGNILVFSEHKELQKFALNQGQMDQIFGGCCGVQRPEDGLGDSGDDDKKCPNGAPIWKVNPVSMNLYMKDIPIWYEPEYGPSVSLALSYNTQSSIAQNEIFGNKWISNYSTYVVLDPGATATVFMPDGRRDVYVLDDTGNYVAPLGIDNQLVELSANHFVLKLSSGHEYEYDIPAGTNSLQPFLVKLTDISGLSLHFSYDANVRLIGITDAKGKSSNLVYNQEGLVTEVRDPFGRSALFEYDSNRNLVKLTDMGGYWTEIDYDNNIYVSALRNPLGETRFEIEPSSSASNGTVVYPAPGEAMWENYRITITDPEQNKEEYFYNGDSGYSWYVSPNHYVEFEDINTNNFTHAKKTRYDFVRMGNTGKVSKITLPAGDYIVFSYDSETGKKQSISDSQANTTQYTYNSAGRIKTITKPNGEITTYGYDSNGQDLISVTSGLGLTSILYDSNRRPTHFTDINNKNTSVTYNSFGQIDSITDTLNQIVSYDYNESNQLIQVKHNGQVIESYSYGAYGRIQTTTRASGLVEQYSYNDLNSLTQVRYPDDGTINYSYSSCPRLIDTATNRGDRQHQYRYDGLKRKIESIAPGGLSTKFVYDGNSNLTQLIDANHIVTTFDYDDNDRLSKKTYADGLGYELRYNNIGKLSQRTDARGIVTTYSYDAHYNLISIVYSDDTPDVIYEYDLYDRLTQIVDGVGTTSYRYNPITTLLESIDGPYANDTQTYHYDDLNRINKFTIDGSDNNTEYAYDDLNRLSDIIVGGKIWHYDYFANSDLVSTLTLPSGVKTSYTRDAVIRLNSLKNETSTGQLISSYHFQHSAQDMIQTETREGTLPQVNQVGLETYSSNALNQITNKDLKSYNYDQSGNLIKGYTPKGYEFTATYDAEQRLKALSYTDSDNRQRTVEYAYHANHLLAKTKRFQDSQLASETRILRIGFNAKQERDQNNEVIKDYTWGRSLGGGIGGLLNLKSVGQDYYYHYDGKGNVTAITNSSQQKVAEYRYNDYGTINSQSGSLDQPYQYSTKRYDAETGLMYFGYRFYVPEKKTWLTRDPIEESGGLNIFGYVGGESG